MISSQNTIIVWSLMEPTTKGFYRDSYRILRKMHGHGLELFIFYSLRRTHLFVMIRLSLEKMSALAEKLEFKMLLDEERLKEVANAGNPLKNIQPIDIPHYPEETEIRPYEMIYTQYRNEFSELYWKEPLLNHPFRFSINPSFLSSLSINIT